MPNNDDDDDVGVVEWNVRSQNTKY